MYTRCPKCRAIYPVTAALLSHSRGLVQCGECDRSFSSLSFLFDEWPTGKAQGPAKAKGAVPPVLANASRNITKNTARKAATKDSIDAEIKEETEKAIKSRRQVWLVATSLLFVLTIANASWTFRTPLKQIPQVNAWLNQSGESGPSQGELKKDPTQIQLVSRDMHTHPTRTGILVLSLTFVNLAQFSQVYPEMEITLLDATNQQVARRRFQPADYLRAGSDTQLGLATDVYLPVLLELGDPGDQAVGFEIRFF